jgi:hypothetical protein
MSYTEVWVVMVKRKDDRVFCDMHKCYGSRFWLTEQDAQHALKNLETHLIGSYHVVPILCCTDEIWCADRHKPSKTSEN